jgi:hypothetical protein
MSPVIQARDGAALDLSLFWKAMVTRLSTAAALRLFNGGKVYRGTDDYSKEERTGDSQPWGREVILPIETLWPAVVTDPDRSGWGWLVRSEMKVPDGVTYDAAATLARLQQIVWDMLIGWTPTPAEVGVVLRGPIWPQRPPQRMPEWDDGRRLWWVSSEWRAEGSRPV